MSFIGSEKCRMDINRFRVPCLFMRAFNNRIKDRQVVLRLRKSDSGLFIEVFPAEYFNERLSKVVKEVQKEEILKSCFFTKVSTNRITIPKHLINATEIDKEIWVVGMFDYFEIWNLKLGNKLFGADERILNVGHDKHFDGLHKQ